MAYWFASRTLGPTPEMHIVVTLNSREEHPPPPPHHIVANGVYTNSSQDVSVLPQFWGGRKERSYPQLQIAP